MNELSMYAFIHSSYSFILCVPSIRFYSFYLSYFLPNFSGKF